MAKVTPWEVSGTVDYEKLLKRFGVSALDDALVKRLVERAGSTHHMLRRNIFFAHRDLKWFLDRLDKGEDGFLYTGRAPSGHTHLGHLVPWLFTKWLQDALGLELWFQFPDDEKFLFKENLTLEDTAKYTEENMLDVIALGLDPGKTRFLVDTRHAGLMYPEAIKVAKRITYSTAKAAFGFTPELNIGAVFYTAMQAVPAFLPSVLAGKKRPCLIPHAIDQDPHFRVSRDVIPKVGFDKPASIQCRFLPGLQDAGGKMSTSADPGTNVVFTTDDAKTIKRKINKYAFSGGKDTVDEHRDKGGDPDIDVAFQYLFFFEEDDAKLARIYADYKEGKLLSGELKALLIQKLTAFLAEHQRKREAARSKVQDYLSWSAKLKL